MTVSSYHYGRGFAVKSRNYPSLWFKQVYADAILRAEKTDTIRAKPHPAPVGALVFATVGPRPPFALLEITANEPIALAALPSERQANLRRLYPGAEHLYRLAFRIAAV